MSLKWELSAARLMMTDAGNSSSSGKHRLPILYYILKDKCTQNNIQPICFFKEQILNTVAWIITQSLLIIAQALWGYLLKYYGISS